MLDLDFIFGASPWPVIPSVTTAQEPMTVPSVVEAPVVEDLQPDDDHDAADWQEVTGPDGRQGWQRSDLDGCEVVDLQPCPVCGGLEIWQDPVGGRHCPTCRPPSPRSAVLLELAQRIQERYRKAP
ncbi:MAG: hypothetical protein NTY19_27715 [Planctomycetota bacterium]|nr:hypothetical protein [Planctomycetota bacterium]